MPLRLKDAANIVHEGAACDEHELRLLKCYALVVHECVSDSLRVRRVPIELGEGSFERRMQRMCASQPLQ